MSEVDERGRARRTFGRTVLLGLAGAALAAVAGARVWVHATGDAAGLRVAVDAKGSDVAPLAGALALVALAAWGVLLVTRGRVRRVVAVLGVLAALGSAAGAVTGLVHHHAAVLALLQDRGATTVSSSHVGGWPWAGLVGAVVTALAFAVAVRRAASWPAMGSRYDAPGSAPSPAAAEAPADTPMGSMELWKAMDEGRDPTGRDAP